MKMLRWMQFTIALFVISIVPSSLYSLDIDWGTDREDVLSEYGDGITTERPAGSLYPIEIYGVHGNVLLRYENDELSSAAVYIYENAFHRLLPGLTDDFGDPDERTSSTATWSSSQLDITLALNLQRPSRTIIEYTPPSSLSSLTVLTRHSPSDIPDVAYNDHEDEFTGSAWRQIELQRYNSLNYLAFRRFPDSDMVVMAFRYHGSSWIFADSIYFIVDDTRREFHGGNTDRDTRPGGNVREWVTWTKPIDDFLHETVPGQVRYSARGSRGRRDAELTPEQIAALADFLTMPYEQLPTN